MKNERRLQVDQGDVGTVGRIERLWLADWRHGSTAKLDDALHVFLHPVPILIGAKELAHEQTSDVEAQTVDQPSVGPHLLLDVDTNPLTSESVTESVSCLVYLVDDVVTI